MTDRRDAAEFYYDEFAGLFGERWGSDDAAGVIAALDAWRGQPAAEADRLRQALAKARAYLACLSPDHQLSTTPRERMWEDRHKTVYVEVRDILSEIDSLSAGDVRGTEKG